MSINHIQKVRQEIFKYFDPKAEIANSRESIESPDGRFRIQTRDFKQNDRERNWNVREVKIYDQQAEEQLFEFFINSNIFFYHFLTKAETDYLICQEDLHGGQTIIDLSSRKMVSYSPDEDGFIWTKFHPSPDGNKLAVSGCVWGSMDYVVVYDFSDPLALPLKTVNEISLKGTEEILGWADNNHLITDMRPLVNVFDNPTHFDFS